MRRIMMAAVVTVGMAGIGTTSAAAHRSGCHKAHSCPSDRATYKWQGKYCKSPKNGGNSSYGKKVVYQGLVYYCR